MQIVDDAERQEHRTETRPAALEATFLDTATSSTADLRVEIPAFGSDIDWPAIGWQPRVDDAGARIYPRDGDEAAVVITDKGRAWVAGWRPKP
jgi:hypothetical protein